MRHGQGAVPRHELRTAEAVGDGAEELLRRDELTRNDDEVAALRADLDDSRTSNASPEAVAAYRNTIAELEKQLASARQGATAGVGYGAATATFTNRSGRATVLNVGPSNAFVVLNYGSARGAQLGQRLNVSQGTDVVATVHISDVRTQFSIAQVQPDTLRGVLQKGDSAVLLRSP